MAKLPDIKTLNAMESLLNVASDLTRLKIMYLIMDNEKPVSEVAKEVGASQSLVSHQLLVLRKAHLVSSRKEGTKVFYSLDDDHVKKLLDITYCHAKEGQK